MKRWHDDIGVARRNWKRHYRLHVEDNVGAPVGYGLGQRKPNSDPRDVACPCDRQIGRFRKRDAFDCGHAACWLCHCDKVPKRRPTVQELISLLRLAEQMCELEKGSD